MAPRLKYNPQTNRWEPTGGGGEGGTQYNPETGTWDPVNPTTTTTPKQSPTTTTVPKQPTTTTTMAPKAGTTTKKQGGTSNVNRVTSPIPSRPSTPRAPLDYDPNLNKDKPDTKNWLQKAVDEALSSGDTDLAMRLLQADSGSGGSSGPTTAQKVAAAKKYGRENLALAKKFYGQQQTQANKAINDATAEFLKNMGQSTAYNQVPLVTVPPALQGLQQNLLAYGATGQEAAGQQAQDQQIADMYTALANRGATQMGNAETAYMDALRRAGLGAQTAGIQGVAGNTQQLQNAVMMANLQAILNAQQ